MRYRNSTTGVIVSCNDDTITALGPGWVPDDGQAGSSGPHLHFESGTSDQASDAAPTESGAEQESTPRRRRTRSSK